MGSLGMQEIMVIFVLALIIFGPRKLPDIGKTLGKGMAEFKKASNELKRTWEEEVELEKGKESMSSLLKDTADLKQTVENELSFENELRIDEDYDSPDWSGSTTTPPDMVSAEDPKPDNSSAIAQASEVTEAEDTVPQEETSMPDAKTPSEET